jgi:hypothetical protein
VVDPDRLGDVLDLLIAEVVKCDRQLVADLIPDGSRDTDRAGVSHRLNTSCDVDPVAEQIGTVDDHITDMDANAELHARVRAPPSILSGDRRLHRDCALHGIDRAGEVGNDAVAGGVEDAAPVRRDQLIDDDAT